ncbi:MAG TPA: hypothetical protein PLF13_06290 [candidate division Zixibacteria bacterium]|nr:hypothetical protein [candidate division Zixibacteria bacterium]
METYRLKSKLVENDREYVIQTSNDAGLSSVSSMIIINGDLAETVASPHPDDIESAEVLSLVRMKHDELKREIEVLLEAYRRILKDGNPQTMLHLAMAFYYRSFYEEACRLLRSATRIDNEFHQAFNYLCMAEIALENPREAVEAGQTACRLRPTFADYHNNLGEAYLEANACRQALTEFEEATRINLYYADAYVNTALALILNAINQDDQSLFAEVISRSTDCLNKAIVISPEYDSEQFRNGMIRLTQSDINGAYRLLRKARDDKRERHRQEFSTFYMKYVLYPEWASEGAVADRVKFLRSELEKNPNYVDLYSELGRCYLEQAKMAWRNGVEQYRKALEMNPSLTKAQISLEQATRASEQISIALKEISAKG